MDFNIRECESIDSYLTYWTESMKHLEFVKNPTPYDYHLEAEQVDLVETFQKKERFFLQAENKNNGELVGLLDIILHGDTAKFGIWQPSVLMEYRETGVGSALVERAFDILKTKGVNRIFATLKYGNSSESEWHKSLYNEVGFESRTQEGVQLLFTLDEMHRLPSIDFSGEIVTGSDFSLEQISELTVQAFGSTSEDQDIHKGWQMDDFENVQAIHNRIKDGVWGDSPTDLWKIAIVDGRPAGFIIGFLRESKYKPKIGVIGELGVLPQNRKLGIAYALVRSLQESFKEYDCVYSFVGTPHNNRGGIFTYNKAGYNEVNRVIHYEIAL